MRSCKQRPIVGRTRLGGRFAEVGQLDEVERKVIAPALTPIADHQRQCLVVRDRAGLGVTFALIPNRPAHRVADERMDHRIEQHAWLAFGVERSFG